jgi:hypothetical protein
MSVGGTSEIVDMSNRAAEALEAARTVGSLWAALAKGSDDAVRRVVVEGWLARAVGREPGLAHRLRRLMGKTREDCALMGVVSRVYAYADGSYEVHSLPLSRPGPNLFLEDRMEVVTILVVVPLNGTGWVFGPREGRPGQETVEEIDLPSSSPGQTV